MPALAGRVLPARYRGEGVSASAGAGVERMDTHTQDDSEHRLPIRDTVTPDVTAGAFTDTHTSIPGVKLDKLKK